MTPRLNISRAGLEFIKAHEGFRRRAARLPDGRYVIGYSHTVSTVEGAEVSAEDAEKLLIYDLKPVIEAVNDLVYAPLSQNQFDALVSLAFNIGLRGFKLSGVVSKLNEGRVIDAAGGFDVFRKAKIEGRTHIIDALVRRRAAEKALFLKVESGPVAAPSAELPVVADPDAVNGLPPETPLAVEVDLESPRAGARLSAQTSVRASDAAAAEAVERLARILPAEITGPRAIATDAEAAPEPKGPRLVEPDGAARVAPVAGPDPTAPIDGDASGSFEPPAPYPLSVAAENGARSSGGASEPGWDPTTLAWDGEVLPPPPGARNPAPIGWLWLFGLLGVIVSIGSLYQISLARTAPDEAFAQSGWSAAFVCGLLAVAVSGYVVARRLLRQVEGGR